MPLITIQVIQGIIMMENKMRSTVHHTHYCLWVLFILSL